MTSGTHAGQLFSTQGAYWGIYTKQGAYRVVYGGPIEGHIIGEVFANHCTVPMHYRIIWSWLQGRPFPGHMGANVVTALFDSKSLCWDFHCLSLHLIDANLATGWHHHQHKFPNLGTTLGIIFRCKLCKLVIWCICFNSYISCVEMTN